jgi:hypothetical protein
VASDREVEEFTGAVMALVEVIRRGQSRAFNTEQVAMMQLLAASDALLPVRRSPAASRSSSAPAGSRSSRPSQTAGRTGYG